MAAKKNEIEERTFYLYDYSNSLVKRTKKIYSPYNIKTLGRVPSEDYYSDPDSVEFKDGQYVAKSEKLWKVRYEQQIEWLAFYNTRWGSLSKWNEKLKQFHINGRWYKNDWIHQVHVEKIKTDVDVKTKTITEKIEVQQIPKIIAETMNVKQLRELATAWWVELSPDVLEWGDAGKIKSSVIETMTQAGHIN